MESYFINKLIKEVDYIMAIDKKKLNSILNSRNEELSKTERKINEFVLDYPEQVIYDSISNIATKLKIGEASLVRYFKKLGYQSFSHFKMELYKAVESSREVKDNSYLENVTANLIDVIEKTKKVVNKDIIEEATNLILKSKQVFIAGMGISHTSALDMFSKFVRIGVNANVIDDSHFMYMYTAILDSECCAIIYSFSGETAEMIKFAKDCKAKGIKVIVISNYINSTLHTLSDIFIETRGFDNDIYSGFYGAKISQLYISDLLVTNCALKNIDKTREYNEIVTNFVI